MNDPLSIIRERLKTQNQRELADELGVSEGHLCHVIKGRRRPGERMLKALGLERVTVYLEVNRRA